MIEQTIASTTYQTRPYQTQIIRDLIDLYSGTFLDPLTKKVLAPHRSLLIESATGSGKTCMALISAKILQKIHPDLNVVWVAMRRNLLSQASGEARDHNIDLGGFHFISMFDKDPEEVMLVAKEGKKILLVIDEGHHEAATSCVTLIDKIDPTFILSMSATPFRQDRMKLGFDRVIKNAGINRLMQDGYLSQYDHYVLNDWHPKTVAGAFLADRERWGKSVFFWKNLNICHRFGNYLKKKGVRAEVVTGETDCDDQIKRFKSGELEVLVNCQKLTEGFDCPDLKTAWIRDSSKGPTIQMGGRAFRKHPDIQFKQIVQSKNTRWPMEKTAKPHQTFLQSDDKVWRSLTPNENVEEITTRALMIMATTNVEMPKFMTARGNVLKRDGGRAARGQRRRRDGGEGPRQEIFIH